MQGLDALLGRIRRKIEAQGFCYEPCFQSDQEGKCVVALARKLGPLFVPGGLDSELPAITTRPDSAAPAWRPFDRPEGIGWHNDFSTLLDRPKLSVIWIAEADPAGDHCGAWRVASVAHLVSYLEARHEGQKLLHQLRHQRFPLGYEGDRPKLFRVLEPLPDGDGLGMRFYGRALLEGARMRFGRVPTATRHLIESLTQAADAVGRTFPACRGALLIADNQRSMHDRTAQTTRGDRRRCSLLCFVQNLMAESGSPRTSGG